MTGDAARQQGSERNSALQAYAHTANRAPVDSAWSEVGEGLGLVLEPERFETLVAEAAVWAERVTLCVTAPQSQQGSLPWWGELLARSSKCDHIYVRRPEQTESWLLHRLHDTGALRLVSGGGKQVAANVMLFARGAERRVLLAHIALDRAVAGAPFGALLCAAGASSGRIARACDTQADSWAERAHIPSGSEVDALALDPRRREEPPSIHVPSGLRVVTDAGEIAKLVAAFDTTTAGESEAGVTAVARTLAGGHQLQIHARDATPVALTLHAGPSWALGNALLLKTRDGRGVLVWRGGLLGHTRSKQDLLWSEARLEPVVLEDAALGGRERAALVAVAGAPLGAQLGHFARELARLGAAFRVEPPPALAHAVADFSELSDKQQLLLVWRALLGLGALELGVAARIAAEVLRDQGYLRARGADPAQAALAALLASADESRFDRPSAGQVRAVQRDFAAYVLDDWLECVLRAAPEGERTPARSLTRRAAEWARRAWGLEGEPFVRPSRLERALDTALATAVRQGLLVRVGAGSVLRLGPSSPCPPVVPTAPPGGAHNRGFVAGWADELAGLGAVQRAILSRRSGWYGKREPIESIAQRLGLSLERARQFEADGWQHIATRSAWLEALEARLERALGGGRAVAVRTLARDDAYWQGIERHLDVADAAFESLLGGRVRRVEVGGAGQREVLFARFSQADVDRALDALLARASELPTPTTVTSYTELAGAAGAELDPVLADSFCDVVEARLELSSEDPSLVEAFRAAAEGALEHPTSEEPKGSDSEALLRLEDTLRSVFRSAGTPLSLENAAERVRQRLDVEGLTLAERLGKAPFVQRNADQYGLIARDVPGGFEAIAELSNAVSEALLAKQRALTLDEACELMPPAVKRAWAPELVRSLLASDPAFALTASNDITLRRWQHADISPAPALACPGIPPRLRPHFERLAEGPALELSTLLERIRGDLARLERGAESEDWVALALARELGDSHERLLEHVGSSPLAAQRLAQASARFFLDVVAPDEVELDAPVAERERLEEARLVLGAVLIQLGLDWQRR